jgi:hypothetical protein
VPVVCCFRWSKRGTLKLGRVLSQGRAWSHNGARRQSCEMPGDSVIVLRGPCLAVFVGCRAVKGACLNSRRMICVRSLRWSMSYGARLVVDQHQCER